MGYAAKIVLDSVGPNGARLTTFEFTYPRFVHAELMTHRVFSRNSASSRAIPTKTLLERVENDPVMPVWWGKNQPGMQSREELDSDRRRWSEHVWKMGAEAAAKTARQLLEYGLHKQVANRVVEPWMFITVLVTATEWSNFFALRDHPDAQPELATVAAEAHLRYRDNRPRELGAGQWHLPLVAGKDEEDLRAEGVSDHDLCKISVGRCARVSYLTHDGVRDPEADKDLFDKLVKSGHMSPLEHVAQAMTREAWHKYGAMAAMQWADHRIPPGNLWGWNQLRKTVEGEHDFSSRRGSK